MLVGWTSVKHAQVFKQTHILTHTTGAQMIMVAFVEQFTDAQKHIQRISGMMRQSNGPYPFEWRYLP